MADCMEFPKDWEKFLEDYSFRDHKECYTNGARLIPVFRVEQMMHHYLRKATEDSVPRGVTIQQWIPVTERLPDIVDTYLVVVKYKYDYETEYTIDTDVATYNPYEKAYIDDCWNTYIDWDEGQQYLHVTHWMPLPSTEGLE